MCPYGSIAFTASACNITAEGISKYLPRIYAYLPYMRDDNFLYSKVEVG